MNLREKLLATKPKVRSFLIGDITYFYREFTVGDMNKAVYGQQQALFKIAQEQGIELNFDNEEALAKQLAQVYDPYQIARTLATRLCDEKGENLFNPNNDADLEQLSQLDKSVFEELSKAIADIEPKNLPSAEDSK